jgi:hypothetical protein
MGTLLGEDQTPGLRRPEQAGPVRRAAGLFCSAALLFSARGAVKQRPVDAERRAPTVVIRAKAAKGESHMAVDPAPREPYRPAQGNLYPEPRSSYFDNTSLLWTLIIVALAAVLLIWALYPRSTHTSRSTNAGPSVQTQPVTPAPVRRHLHRGPNSLRDSRTLPQTNSGAVACEWSACQ